MSDDLKDVNKSFRKKPDNKDKLSFKGGFKPENAPKGFKKPNPKEAEFKKTEYKKPSGNKRTQPDKEDFSYEKESLAGTLPPLQAMEKAVLKAGRYLKRDFGEVENLQTSQKGSGSFVTSADLKSEKIIVEELRKYFPDYPILSEEAGCLNAENEQFCFILDPIDGTTNFMHGLPFFCISLALQETDKNGNKEIIAACVYAPILEELYLAEKGKGATMNNKRLTVSGRNTLEHGVFAAYLAKYDKEQRACDQDALNSTILHTRILGSAALELCFVAAGKLEGMWHWRLHPWDIAAGSLIVKEARGMVSEINGEQDYLNTGSILATNSTLHEKLRKKIHPCYS